MQTKSSKSIFVGMLLLLGIIIAGIGPADSVGVYDNKGIWTLWNTTSNSADIVVLGWSNTQNMIDYPDGGRVTKLGIYNFESNNFLLNIDSSFNYINNSGWRDGTPYIESRSNNSQVIDKICGIDFSPYMDGQNPEYGHKVDREQIQERMQIIAPYTIWIRTYGTENGLEYTAPLARDMGLKTAIGAWLGRDSAANERQINELINEMNAGHVDLAIVGSETLYRNDLSEDQLIDYIRSIKQAVPGINVTTADTYSELLSHPNVIEECDVVMYNSYPYWDGTGIEDAIAVLDSHHKNMINMTESKEVIISETGWPSGGNTVGSAVPSPENSARYFNEFISWAHTNNIQYFYFEAFDETWKVNNEGPQGAHWGIWDKEGILKPGMEAVFYKSVNNMNNDKKSNGTYAIMLDYKKWLFSGAGLVILGLLYRIYKNKHKTQNKK